MQENMQDLHQVKLCLALKALSRGISMHCRDLVNMSPTAYHASKSMALALGRICTVLISKVHVR